MVMQNRNIPLGLVGISKTWEQSKYLPVDEGIDTLWYNHSVKYYSAIKKKGSTDLYNMDEPQMHFTEWRKPDPKCYILYDSIYKT